MTGMALREGKQHRSTLVWLWHAAGKYKGSIAALVFFQMLFGICGVAFAVLFRNLVDQAAAGKRGDFFRTFLIMAALELAQILLGFFVSYLAEWTRASLENGLKKRLFSSLLYKDYASVTVIHSGEWMNRLTSDTSVVTGGMLEILPGVAGMFSRLAGAIMAMLMLEPNFFLILIPGGILIFLFSASFRKILRRLHQRIQEANGAVISFLQERLESMLVIRVFSMQERTCRNAAEKMERHKAARLRRNLFSNVCSSGFGVVAEGGYLLGVAYGGYGVLQGTISYGTFAAVLQLVGQIQGPFARISGIVPKYYAMLASADRLREAEDFRADGDVGSFSQAELSRFYREEFQGIGVRDASFSYRTSEKTEPGENAVIEHLDLEIRKGEYVAFTGHSGCGKSTLLKLLMCLYPLDAGERYLKAGKPGKEPAEYPLTSAWRGLFAYVPQGNQLMSGTIREIIAFGDPEAMKQEERLARALEVSCADEFVTALEDGLDTLLGERGCGLSEGQMQRIAIARAVFSERPVLILDESTSALDERTEERLLTKLRQMTDRTVLIITHRPAALRICDRQVDMTERAV